MKKTILALTTVLALFAGVPVYASPAADFASKVTEPVTASTSNTATDSESVGTDPTVNIIYQSELDEQAVRYLNRTPSDYWDARDLRKERTTRPYNVKPISPNYSLKPNEKKIVKYVRLCQGQKLDVNIRWYNKTLSNLSVKYANVPPFPKKEVQVEQDGYYLIELVTPPSADASLFTFFMQLTSYEKR